MKTFISVIIACMLIASSNCQEPDKQVNRAYPPGSTVCFEDVGCFSNEPPFNNTGNYLPVEPSLIQTEFLLYTRQSPSEDHYLTYKDLNGIKTSAYNPKLPLKIVIHGFQNSKESKWIDILKSTLLAQGDYNVIVVDWGLGAVFPLYNNASSNTRLVGRQVCLLAKSIAKVFYDSKLSALKIHCIGHSLGAHTCGYASSACESNFDRITAMDPAGPLFEDTDPIVRVDSSDAKFVDVIHTNAGTLITGNVGMVKPIGHIDFYPNGGKFQPECPSVSALITSLIGSDGSSSPEVSCSHSRAIIYFTESILNSEGFCSFSCTSQLDFNTGKCFESVDKECIKMGYYSYESGKRGSYYLQTNEVAPYSIGSHIFVEMFVSQNAEKTAGDLTIYFYTSGEKKIAKIIISKDNDIKGGDLITKVLILQDDLEKVEKIELYYVKRPKTWFTSEVSSKLYFDKLRITSIREDHVYSYCGKQTFVESKETLSVALTKSNC